MTHTDLLKRGLETLSPSEGAEARELLERPVVDPYFERLLELRAEWARRGVRLSDPVEAVRDGGERA